MSSPYHITSHSSIRLRIEARIKDSKPKDVIDLVNRYRKVKYQISDSLELAAIRDALPYLIAKTNGLSSQLLACIKGVSIIWESWKGR